jgi:hypothetical protein
MPSLSQAQAEQILNSVDREERTPGTNAWANPRDRQRSEGLVIASLLLLALLQQSRGPTVMVSVDRDQVSPGEVIVFTVRVTSNLTDPIRVDLPSLGGFELESRSERSDVTTGQGGGRSTLIEFHLRANTPGEWRLGPVTVRQGIATDQSEPITVRITGGAPLQSRPASVLSLPG